MASSAAETSGGPRASDRQPAPASDATFVPTEPCAATVLHVPGTDGRYVRLAVHDQGGMGRIWMAHDVGLDREVALKELHPRLAGNPVAVARFVREALITGQLEHPGVVPVYELACTGDGQQPFYTMRFVKGRTLAQAAQQYHQKRAAGEDVALDLAALLHAFVTVCHTISFAHSRGVLHRDLKGNNVILGDFGEVVVLDWGLAKRIGVADDPEVAGSVESDHPELSQPGQMLGTPASMSPEQAAGNLDQIDHRTDIYGLGGILYEILTGQPPFVGTTTREVLLKVLVGDPTPPRQRCPDVPLGLEAICLRALARQPVHRYDAAKELAEAVQHWQEAERRQAEAALRASEAQYRTLADLIPGIVWTARPDGWIDYANQNWFKFTGLTMEQTEGSGWVVKVHPEDVDRVFQVWNWGLTAGEAVEVDYRLQRADGVYRWFLAQGRPVRDPDGQVIKWFGMLTEIEEQKQGAQALERQNTLVRLLHQVTVAAYEAATVTEALQAGIDQVCQFTGWPVGHVYLRAEDGAEEMVPTAIWHLDHPREFASFVEVTAATRLAPGVGLPGRVLARKAPVWIMDVSREENFPRANAAANLGVKGAFGFPVLTAAGVVAVLEFFTREPKEPDNVLLQAMAQIGLQLGQVFERKRTEAELQAARAAVAHRGGGQGDR